MSKKRRDQPECERNRSYVIGVLKSRTSRQSETLAAEDDNKCERRENRAGNWRPDALSNVSKDTILR